MLCPVTLSCLTVMILILISHGVGMYRNVSNIDGSFPVLSFAAHPAAAKADPHLKPGSEPRLAPDLPCRDTSGMSCGMSCSMLRHWRKGRRPWRTCLADSCSSASPSPGQFCELKKNSKFCQGTRHQEAVNFRVSQQCCSSDLLQSRSIVQIAMSRRERKELNTPNRMLQDLNFFAVKHERTTACECDQMFCHRRSDPSLQPLVELKPL